MATENRSAAIADRWKLRYDTHFASKQTILRLAADIPVNQWLSIVVSNM